jgi:hypothetical protein
MPKKKRKYSHLRSWAVSRHYCNPRGVNVLARSGKEALKLVNHMYGYASGVAYCAETKEEVVQR